MPGIPYVPKHKNIPLLIIILVLVLAPIGYLIYINCCVGKKSKNYAINNNYPYPMIIMNKIQQ